MTERSKFFLISLALLLIFLAPIHSQGIKKENGYIQNRSARQQHHPGLVVKKGEPGDILIIQKFNKTRVRVGEKVACDITLHNKSEKRIYIRDIFSEGGNGKLKLIHSSIKRYLRPLENGVLKKERIYFVAEKAGKAVPPRIKYRFNFTDCWIRDKNGFNPVARDYKSQNSIPRIQVIQVKLPCVKGPACNSEKVNNYFSGFTIKILGIALLIIIILWIIDYAANSTLVYSLFGRVIFTYFMALILSLFLFLVWNGFNCVFHTTLPSQLTIATILGFSCQFTIAFGLVSRRKIFFQSLFYGILLGLSSYTIYIGFKAFEYNNFHGFSFQKIIFMSSIIGLVLNIIFLRKKKQKRRKNEQRTYR